MKQHLNQRTMILALAGLCGSAAATSVTRLDLKVSLDGVNWSSEVNVTEAGQRVQVRAAVSFQQNDGTVTPVGFAWLTWQPTVSNWRGGDQFLPFADRGNNTNGGSVPDTASDPAMFGRLSPFAGTGPSTSDPYRGHVQTASGTNYLRIARTSITNWVGTGTTFGTRAANNFNGAGGLACVQKAAGVVNPQFDPPFLAGVSDIGLFKFAMELSVAGSAREMQIYAPLEGMSRNSVTGAREASWFTSLADNYGALKTSIEVTPATIHVVPAPGSLGAIGLGIIAVSRRRRR